MVDEMRVTVVATGLGEELPAIMQQPEVELKPVRLVSNDAVDQENPDYTALEVPTNIRRSPKTANDFVKAAESKNMEYLDIPAFLRRQAD
jgi:cell division protein FtsZ